MKDILQSYVDQLDAIKAHLWTLYEDYHTSTMFDAIDSLDCAAGSLLVAIDELEGAVMND